MRRIVGRQLVDDGNPFQKTKKSEIEKFDSQFWVMFWVIFTVIIISFISIFGMFAYTAFIVMKDPSTSANKAGQIIREFKKGMNEAN